MASGEPVQCLQGRREWGERRGPGRAPGSQKDAHPSPAPHPYPGTRKSWESRRPSPRDWCGWQHSVRAGRFLVAESQWAPGGDQGTHRVEGRRPVNKEKRHNASSPGGREVTGSGYRWRSTDGHLLLCLVAKGMQRPYAVGGQKAT